MAPKLAVPKAQAKAKLVPKAAAKPKPAPKAKAKAKLAPKAKAKANAKAKALARAKADARAMGQCGGLQVATQLRDLSDVLLHVYRHAEAMPRLADQVQQLAQRLDILHGRLNRMVTVIEDMRRVA